EASGVGRGGGGDALGDPLRPRGQDVWRRRGGARRGDRRQRRAGGSVGEPRQGGRAARRGDGDAAPDPAELRLSGGGEPMEANRRSHPKRLRETPVGNYRKEGTGSASSG